MHPSTHLEVMQRREREFAKATTAADVAKLQKKWEREDRGVKAAQTIEARQLAELRQRVHRLEAILLNEDGDLGDALVDVFAAAPTSRIVS
jgi:hypothetical protein